MIRWAWLLIAAAAFAQPRILYVTHSAGFRHGSIEVSRRVLSQLPGLRVTTTEDLSLLSADRLRDFDAVFFFTSGELEIDERQKRDLIDFVRSGKGFGGVHSATDTLYGWSEYGEMIGGYFDGHPWTEPVTIDIEDPGDPGSAAVAPSFRILEEIYQFRAWDRSKVRVLMTLDTGSVDMAREGVNRTDSDFALAWRKPFGAGRVYYNALGHFDETWLDPRFQRMIQQALLWLAGAVEAPSETRRAIPRPREPEAMSPGAVARIEGEALTLGSRLDAAGAPLPVKLAGSAVSFAGRAAPLFSVSPSEILLQVPYGLPPGQPLDLVVAAGSDRVTIPVRLATSTPRIGAVSAPPGSGMVTIFAIGLGEVDPPVPAGSPAPLVPLSLTRSAPVVRIGGRPADVLFSGLAPGLTGVYQVNAAIPPGADASDVAIEAAR